MPSALATISLGLQLGVLKQSARRGLGIRAARADGEDAVLGLEHVARAGDDERALLVRHSKHGFQAPQHPVGAPVLGELDCRAHQIALVLVELRLESLEERKGVRSAAGKAREDAVLVEAPHLACAALDDNLTERDLTVAAERDGSAATNGKNGGAVELFHVSEVRCVRRRAVAIPRPNASVLVLHPAVLADADAFAVLAQLLEAGLFALASLRHFAAASCAAAMVRCRFASSCSSLVPCFDCANAALDKASAHTMTTRRSTYFAGTASVRR